MNSSSQQHPAQTQPWHPDWCAQAGCAPDASGTIVHSEMPDVTIPSQDGRHFALSRVQCDETSSDGEQIAHDPEAMVHLGGESAVFSADALDAIRDQAAVMADQVRCYKTVTSEAP